MESQKYIVDNSESGERLDCYLTKKLCDITRSQIQKLISENKVIVNGNAVSKNTRLNCGAVVEVVSFQNSREYKITPQDIPFKIIYEDEYIIVIDKPAGIVVHPGNGVKDGTIVNGLINRFNMLSEGFTSDRPGIVHRLDKETSGVLIVAKTNQAHSAMASMFQLRKIHKKYVSFCLGVPSVLHGFIDLPLARSHQDPIKRVPSSIGKESRTEYQVIESKSGISAIVFMPFTGRTHQIRVHASAKGFPIVADKLYGGGKESLMKINPLDRPFAYSILKCFSRHALHAVSINFIHPFTKIPVTFTAPLPDDFNDAVFKFGKTNLFENELNSL